MKSTRDPVSPGGLAVIEFLLTPVVQDLLAATRKILRLLVHTTQIEVEEGRVTMGTIDWPGTMLKRTGAGWQDPSVTVLRRTEIHRDLAEIRLLKFLLREIHLRAIEILTPDLEHMPDQLHAGNETANWRSRVEKLAAETRRLANHPMLEPVPAEASRQGYHAAKVSRTSIYRDVARAYEAYRRWSEPIQRVAHSAALDSV